MNEKLNISFRISLEKLEDTLHHHLTDNDFTDYTTVIPFKAIKHITHATLIKRDTLATLIRNIPLRQDGTPIYPYAKAIVEQDYLSPRRLYIGQTFVMEQKLIALIKNAQKALEAFCAPPLPQMHPLIIYGTDPDGTKSLAFYIPPIVERHDDKDIILDGIHRSFMARKVGQTISAVHISNIDGPPPFNPLNWDETHLVTTKPPIEQRYKNLNPTLYRNLSAVGIDG